MTDTLRRVKKLQANKFFFDIEDEHYRESFPLESLTAS